MYSGRAIFALAFIVLAVGCNPTSSGPSVQQRLIGDWRDDGNQVLRFYSNGTYEGRIGSYGPWMKGQYFVSRNRLRLKELEGEGPFPPACRRRETALGSLVRRQSEAKLPADTAGVERRAQVTPSERPCRSFYITSYKKRGRDTDGNPAENSSSQRKFGSI